MSAYLIANYNVTDPQRLEVYRQAAAPLLVGPGRGQVLAIDGQTDVREGFAGTHTVLIRYESMDIARQIYESAEYQKTIADRLGATQQGVLILVRGG